MSPMATPQCGVIPFAENTPQGKFCKGKSEAGALALSTQDRIIVMDRSVGLL
jgi:hypothetical protein